MAEKAKSLTAEEILDLQRRRADDALRSFRIKLAEELKVLEEREARVRSVLNEYRRRTTRIRKLLGVQTSRSRSLTELRENVTYLVLKRYGPLTLTDLTALVSDELGAQATIDPPRVHAILNAPGAPYRRVDRGLYEVVSATPEVQATQADIARAGEEEDPENTAQRAEERIGDEGTSLEP